MSSKNADPRISAIKEYFAKASVGDPSLLDLFTDDFEFHYYKFGIGRGKAQFAEFHRRGGDLIESIGWHADRFRFIVAENDIVVEGAEFGTTKIGVSFPDNRISSGLFCSVFTFQGNLISRMYIYADPDLTSRDTPTIDVFFRE